MGSYAYHRRHRKLGVHTSPKMKHARMEIYVFRMAGMELNYTIGVFPEQPFHDAHFIPRRTLLRRLCQRYRYMFPAGFLAVRSNHIQTPAIRESRWYPKRSERLARNCMIPIRRVSPTELLRELHSAPPIPIDRQRLTIRCREPLRAVTVAAILRPRAFTSSHLSP